MRLYLMRHGQASENVIDSERSLSDFGERQVGAIAEWFVENKLVINGVWSSPYVRARQTADIFIRNYDVGLQDSWVIDEGLVPSVNVVGVVEQLKLYNEGEGLLVVSHLPFIPLLVDCLLGGSWSEEVFDYIPASVTCLSYDNGFYRLLWQAGFDGDRVNRFEFSD